MLILISNFGLIIIGDLVPDCDEWALFLLLREIVSISCIADKQHVNTFSLLSSLINEPNQLYLKLSKSTLKPKFHIINHYGRIMKNIGPSKQITSIRFEAFHQPLKNMLQIAIIELT